MLENFHIQLISPKRVVLDVELKYLNIPGKLGYMGIGPNHAAMVSELKPGILEVRVAGEEKSLEYFVSGGYLQVAKNKAIVLADVVDAKSDVDEKRALESEKRALMRLKEITDNNLDIKRALNSLERAKARIQLIKRS